MPEMPNPSIKARMSLSLKTTLIVLLTSTLLLSVFGWHRYRQASRLMKQSLQQTVNLAVNRLAASLKTPLFDFDDEGIEAVIRAEMQSSLISGVFVLDGDMIQFGYGRNQSGNVARVKSLLSDEGHLVAGQKIVSVDTQLGQLKVFVTLRYLHEDLKRLLITTVSEVIILDVILLVVLTLFIHSILIKPLNRLVDFIKMVSKGDFSEKADSKSKTGHNFD